MNPERITTEEFHALMADFQKAIKTGTDSGVSYYALLARINAIQSAPFVPDWSLKPEGVDGFLGMWTTGAMSTEPGEFYMPAPSNPTDAELSAMWEKLDRDKRVQILRDAGVVV